MQTGETRSCRQDAFKFKLQSNLLSLDILTAPVTVDANNLKCEIQTGETRSCYYDAFKLQSNLLSLDSLMPVERDSECHRCKQDPCQCISRGGRLLCGSCCQTSLYTFLLTSDLRTRTTVLENDLYYHCDSLAYCAYKFFVHFLNHPLSPL
jgi:uncharacterized protein YacL (UPF0231 family)